MQGDAGDSAIRAPAPRAPSRAPVPAWLSIPVGVVLSAAAFLAARSLEDARIRREFLSAADLRLSAVQHRFDHHLGALETLRSQIECADRWDGRTFARYAGPTLDRCGTIRALAWVPRVAPADAPRIEELVRAEGASDFSIHPPAGAAAPAAADDRYPVLRLEPSLGREELLGLDLGAIPSCRTALEAARRASAPRTWRLAEAGRERIAKAHWITALPVASEAAGSPTPERGFVVALFDLEDILVDVARTLPADSLRLYLDGVEAPGPGEGARASRPPKPPRIACGDRVDAPERLASFGAAGGRFALVCSADPGFLDARRGVLPLATLGGGLLLTGLLALAFGTRELRGREGRRVQARIERERADRDAAERVSRESRRMLATLLDNLPGIAYRCRNDPSWTLEFVSDGCRALTGYPAEELLSQRVTFGDHLIVPEDRTAVWDAVQLALADARPWKIHYRIRDAYGEERWVDEQGRGVFDPSGRLLALEGFITDSTERRRAEAALAANAEILRSALDLAPAAVAILDASLCYLVASRRWRIDHRLGERPLIGLSHLDLFSDTPPEVRAALDRTLAGGSERGTIVRWNAATGALERVQFEARPWRRTDGSVGGLILVHEVAPEGAEA